MLQEELKRTDLRVSSRERLYGIPAGRVGGYLPAGGQVNKASTGDYQGSGSPLFVATVAWEFKRCPKCGGDLFKDDGALVCLQCGFRREIENTKGAL